MLINLISQRKIIKIKTVVTKGKAEYRVLKFSGGQGDNEISLPLGCLINTSCFE